MSDRNWGCISSGATFESLATTLIFFEDAGAALFGRQGKDGGQDARSSDGKRVFQAKHHQDGSAAKAIADAKKEAANIAKYRTSGHPREPQWRGVTHWRLVTNAALNPTDRKTWDSTIVPLFQAQGLVADYWEQANLNALLDKHPEVDRAYFQNETRAFLSLSEFRETLPAREPFLRRDTLGTFVGRDAEIQSIQSFLHTDHLFLLVHGAGGVGKTRVVVEAGERIAGEGTWQVLWANIASMEASGTWFESIVPERPTLLIVDEPENEQLLRVLVEQIGTKLGRASRWKILLAARSPKDPVLKFLFGPRMKSRVAQLCIAALPQKDAESMCITLLGSSTLANNSEEWRISAATELAKRFSNHPIWLTLAVHALETTGDLSKIPETAEDLADLYLSEIAEQQHDYEPETVLGLLRWIALVSPLNRESDTAIELLTKQTRLKGSGAAREALARLANRKALSERGARRRFVEVKPDVLRDHILRKWLSIDVGFGTEPIQPSDDAKQLAEMVLQATLGGTVDATSRSILTSLARTELILRLSGQAVPLLDPFIHGILQNIANTGPSTRVTIAGIFADIAAYRPEDTVRVSQTLRNSHSATERIDGILRSRSIGHDDVVLKLAWPVYHAAFGAQSAETRQEILGELCELAESEFQIGTRLPHGLPNDGQRAKELIGRTLEGGSQFWSDFEDAARAVSTRLLDEAAKIAPDTSRREALKALVAPSISLERRQTWSDGHTFHFRTSVILPGHPAWVTRSALISKLKELLENDKTPPPTRQTLWSLFADGHHTANRCYRQGSEETKASLRQEIVDNLTWAYSVLTERADNLDEISAARNLWDWHERFEEDPELRKLATDLEELYTSNKIAAEFEWLLGGDEPETHSARAATKARELAPAGRDAIEAFLERARNFLNNEHEQYRLHNVAWELGAQADESEAVRDFIFSALGEDNVTPRTNFAAIAVYSWATTRRRREPSTARTLVADLVSRCGSNKQKVNLLCRLYERLPRPKDLGDHSNEELLFIRSHEKLFADENNTPAFVACVTWGLDFDREALQDLLEKVLDATPDEQIVRALDTLVDALYWTLREHGPEAIPPNIGVWMLDQLLRVPDIDSLGGNLEWHINEVLKKVGNAPLTWLPKAIEQRRDLERNRGHGTVHALSHHMRLSRFVSKIGQNDEISDEDKAAVQSLLEFVSDPGSVGYYLHGTLQDIDPHGRIVPHEVACRFRDTDDDSLAYRLARIGGAFVIGTPAWRTIAGPVLAQAASKTPEVRGSLYSALTDHGPRSWSAKPGEVPAVFKSAVESARKHLEAETDHEFRPFWEWRLKIAEAHLRDEEERAKEERGE